MLRSLKMPGMAQAVGDLIEQGAPALDAAVPMLSQLLKAEMAKCEVRSIAYHMKVARFPAYKDLSGFSFSASEINEALVRQLHRCEFMDAAENVVLIGGPGTGKSHVATALGIQAIAHHRKRVRFFSTVDLRTRGISACIPSTACRKRPFAYDKILYKQRHKIEIAFGRLKDWRRIATRYDRCADIFLAAFTLAVIAIFWLQE